MIAILRSFVLLALWAGFAVGPATAQDIVVTGAWARATPEGAANGGVFLTVENRGTVDDRLTRAAADVSRTVQLHTHVLEAGVAKMREVPAIDLPAGATVALKPGGYHVMLLGLKAPLKTGETFPLRLRFERAGERDVQVKVEPTTFSGTAPGH